MAYIDAAWLWSVDSNGFELPDSKKGNLDYFTPCLFFFLTSHTELLFRTALLGCVGGLLKRGLLGLKIHTGDTPDRLNRSNAIALFSFAEAKAFIKPRVQCAREYTHTHR